LLPLPVETPLPLGVVNDGGYLGAWLHAHHGRLAYAVDARVRIEIPRTPAGHLRQRRRILWGHRQVREMLGVAPTTWHRFARRHPGEAVRTLLSVVVERPRSIPWTALLVLLEVEAYALAGWDRTVAGKDHVRWDLASPSGPASPRPGRAEPSLHGEGERAMPQETS
jgi:hypothetical protein